MPWLSDSVGMYGSGSVGGWWMRSSWTSVVTLFYRINAKGTVSDPYQNESLATVKFRVAFGSVNKFGSGSTKYWFVRSADYSSSYGAKGDHWWMVFSAGDLRNMEMGWMGALWVAFGLCDNFFLLRFGGWIVG